MFFPSPSRSLCWLPREGRCVPPRLVVSTEQCVQLLSGSLHAYESPSRSCYMRFTPDVTAKLGWPRASRTAFFSFIFSVSCYQDDLKNLPCVLCYVALLRLRLRLSSALHLHTSVALSPFPVLPRHVLTARCLSAAYPGIQPMVLYLCSSYPSPFLQCHCPFY